MIAITLIAAAAAAITLIRHLRALAGILPNQNDDMIFF
jgi:hypothetical protein